LSIKNYSVYGLSNARFRLFEHYNALSGKNEKFKEGEDVSNLTQTILESGIFDELYNQLAQQLKNK
jgi:hypothetical protein